MPERMDVWANNYKKRGCVKIEMSDEDKPILTQPPTVVD